MNDPPEMAGEAGAQPVERRPHIPVLLAETLGFLAPRPGETALDATVGLGGHARAIAERLGTAGTLILNDADPANLAAGSALVAAVPSPPRIVEFRGNFADAPRRMVEAGLRADLALADLGFSSNQVEAASRGLSFSREGPLDMRLDPSGPLTAAALVNTLSEQELGEIIRDHGEERRWRQVARKLVAERGVSPIETTTRLAAIVRSVVGPNRGESRIDPATRTFQALRIAVNDELGSLRSLLESVTRAAAALGREGGSGGGERIWLRGGARIGIIAFHSLEDRLVKQVFGELVSRGLARRLGRWPIEASEAERVSNPRSRSAKMRLIQLCGQGGPRN